MKHTTQYIGWIGLLLMAFSATSYGQVALGTPDLGSFGGGPFDIVNLGNLNVHFVIPVRHKAGRGTPFIYDLTYDSSVWYPTIIGGSTVWQPYGGAGGYWGWIGLNATSRPGGLTYSTTVINGHCGTMGQYAWTQWMYNNFAYTDENGKHNFNYTDYYIQVPNGATNCPTPGPQPATTPAIPASDGSGLTLYATPGMNSMSAYVTTATGTTFNGIGFSNSTDANGNEVTLGASGVYTDTLGQTALTVAGAPPSNTTLTYTAPSGSGASYTVSYTPYTVKTNFGCTGVGEYNVANLYLVNRITLPDASYYQFTYEQTPGGTSGQTTARLASVLLPTGGTITYQYTGSHNGINCGDGSAAGLTRTTSPGGQWTYVRTQGGGNQWTTLVTDPTTPTSNQTLLTFQKDSNLNTFNFYEVQRKVYQGAMVGGTLLSTTTTCYNTAGPIPANCPTANVGTPISRRTVFNYFPDTSGAQSEVDTQYFSGIAAFPSEVDTYNYHVGSVGSLLSKVVAAYGVYGSVVAPTSVTTTDSSGNILSKTTTVYDGSSVIATSGTPQLASVTGGRGNPTTVNTYTNASTYLTKTFSYYDTGNVYQATDVNTAVTTYTYGACGNSFLTSTSIPLSLSTSGTWDCVGGVQKTSVDVNGNTTTTAYTDANFWRPASITDPASNVMPFTYYTPVPSRTEIHVFFNGGNSIAENLTTLDGFGRTLVAQRQQAPGVSNFDTVETDYDVVGRPSRTTMPYFSNTYGQTNSSAPATTTTYDALNRPLTVTDGGSPTPGTLTYSYAKNDVLQTIGPAPTGENTKKKQLEYDALGRLTSVCEITSGTTSYPGASCGQNTAATGYLTTYSYGFDTGTGTNTVTVSQSGQTRTYKYDLLSRLVSETNPESGTTQYVYDVNSGTCVAYLSPYPNTPGDRLSKYDANGNSSCYMYDTLHRLQAVYYYGSNTTPSKHFFYDNASLSGTSMSNAKGQLAEAYTCTPFVASCAGNIIADEYFSYDSLGNNTDVYESTPTSGGYYHTTASYYPNGVPNTLVAPVGSAPTITYAVDGEGRVSTVSSSSGQNPVTATSYNVASQVTGVTFGSGDSDSYQFDPNTGRMTQYQFKMGTLTDTGVLTWNPNGSLGNLAITDQINSANTQTCGYQHDDLQRVSSVNCGSTWNQSFTYDPFGNITKSGSISWMPGYNTSNHYTLAGTGYDNNGNLLNDSVHSYAWDAGGNPLAMDGVLNLTYDALGRMVQYSNSSVNVSMLMGPLGNKPLATMSGMTVGERFVPLPGGAAMLSAYGYRHGDWLGSSRLLTSFSQTLVSDLAYAPFGETYAATGSSPDPAFTQGSTESAGQFLSTSLYDFDFRKYAHAQGRWISPDPAGLGAADPTNPQSWNRYAYVLNSPLNNIDPLGLITQACPSGQTWQNGQCVYGQCRDAQGYVTFNGIRACGPAWYLGWIMDRIFAGVGSITQNGGGGSGAANPKCPGKIVSGINKALVMGLGTGPAAAGQLLAVATGHVVTVGYDGSLGLRIGTFGASVHAGDALAFDPQGNIALISTTGAGAGGFGDAGAAATGQLGIMRATSVLSLESGSTISMSIGGGAGAAGQVGVDLEGNVTLGIGAGDGVSSISNVDISHVNVLSCGP